MVSNSLFINYAFGGAAVCVEEATIFEEAVAAAPNAVGQEIADQRGRSLFQIHPEVLAVHGRPLDVPGDLSPAQEARLKKSRDLLQRTITGRFSSLFDQDNNAAFNPTGFSMKPERVTTP